jgi:choice-of-anchor C domain-containing protein
MAIKTKLALAAVAVSLWAGAASAAAIVSNGSFELGINGPGSGSFATIPGASLSSITDWTVVGSVDWINGYWQASDGTHSVDLNGVALGGVQQLINTVAGQSYRLTFDLSANPDHLDSHPDQRTLLAAAGLTNAVFTYKFDTPPGGTNTSSNMNWSSYFLDFTAIANTTLLAFNSTSGQNCCWGPALDNVAVTAIPEASTWAMMLLGFLGVGFVAYRRKSNVPLRIA